MATDRLKKRTIYLVLHDIKFDDSNLISLIMFGELNSLTDFSEKSPPKVSSETTSIM